MNENKELRVAVVVPAKSSSNRIFNKNAQIIGGYPLFLYKLRQLLQIKAIDDIYLDTDSEDYIKQASYLPVKILKRDPKLATNATDGHELFMNEVKNINADIIIQTLCTSPFVSEKSIVEAIEQLRSNQKIDSVVLFQKSKVYGWQDNQPLYGTQRIPNSFDLPDTINEAMSLYGMRKKDALQLNRRFGDRVYPIYADSLELVDINNPDDLELARLIADGLHMREQGKLQYLSKLYSSAMLSDILDDLGQRNCVIAGLNPNMSHVSVFGRAKTMKLRSMDEEEDFRGIYDALQSYQHISQGDIIVVENDTPQHAYFGDLNARLALRSGAAAALIGGATRDNTRVLRLGFPVFAEGKNAQDVRRRAVVEHMNKPISIKGIDIFPGELIFCDSDAIVRIPLSIEKKVMDLATESALRENGVAHAIMRGDDIKTIIQDHGDF